MMTLSQIQMRLSIMLLCLGMFMLVSSTENAPKIDLSMYHTSSELSRELYNLQGSCPSLKIREVNRHGASMMEIRIGTGRRRATMYFGEHPRELISAELALHFVTKLCRANKKDPVLSKAVRQVLGSYRIQIFPNINVHGRRLVESGKYCHRTNSRGVDLNRNWDVAWKPDGTKETAPGPSAFSEPETKLLRDMLHKYEPSVFMSIHSGALGMYMPYAYKKESQVSHKDHAIANFLTQGRRNMFRVLEEVNLDFCRCKVGAAAIELNYVCPGNCMDYAFEKLQIPYSFAFEVWDGTRFANQRTMSLLESSSEAMLDGMHEDSMHHDHEHEHEHESEHEHELEADAVSEGEASFLSLGERVAAPKNTPQRGHSCFTNFDNFAPSDELEGVGFIEVGAEVNPKIKKVADPFPTEGVVGERLQCLKQFNPLSKAEFEGTLEHWSNAFLDIFKKLPGDPMVKFPQTIN